MGSSPYCLAKRAATRSPDLAWPLGDSADRVDDNSSKAGPIEIINWINNLGRDQEVPAEY